MTPEQLAEAREEDARFPEGHGVPRLCDAFAAIYDRRLLIAEVDRLRTELAEARLAAEEAWDAHDEKENA